MGFCNSQTKPSQMTSEAHFLVTPCCQAHRRWALSMTPAEQVQLFALVSDVHPAELEMPLRCTWVDRLIAATIEMTLGRLLPVGAKPWPSRRGRAAS
jgi:hypothetical protein